MGGQIQDLVLWMYVSRGTLLVTSCSDSELLNTLHPRDLVTFIMAVTRCLESILTTAVSTGIPQGKEDLFISACGF